MLIESGRRAREGKICAALKRFNAIIYEIYVQKIAFKEAKLTKLYS